MTQNAQTTQEQKASEIPTKPAGKLGKSFKIKELKIDENGVRLQLCNVRQTFCNLATPDTKYSKADSNGEISDGKYTTTSLIPKSPEVLKEISKYVKICVQKSGMKIDDKTRQKAYENALSMAEGALIKDGNDQISEKDGKIYAGHENHYTLRAHTQAEKTTEGFKPKMGLSLVDRKNQPISREDQASELYSGIWADVILTLKPFKNGTNVGVTAYLNAVRKLMDDEKFGGGTVEFEDTRDDLDDVESTGSGASEDSVESNENSVPGFLDED